MLIREIKPEDAEELRILIKEVESSSPFMLMEPGERGTTVEQQRELINQFKQQDNSTIIVAELDGRLVGYLFAIGGRTKRNRHSVYLVIGIHESYRGKGIGSALFQYVEEWAVENDVTRLELTVVVENKAGVALYEKRGFVSEGTKRKSLLINGVYHDEYYMAKLLGC